MTNVTLALVNSNVSLKGIEFIRKHFEVVESEDRVRRNRGRLAEVLELYNAKAPYGYKVSCEEYFLGMYSKKIISENGFRFLKYLNDIWIKGKVSSSEKWVIKDVEKKLKSPLKKYLKEKYHPLTKQEVQATITRALDHLDYISN